MLENKELRKTFRTKMDELNEHFSRVTTIRIRLLTMFFIQAFLH